MHTLRRKLVSESLMRSNLRLHNSNIRLRSSCNRILGEIIGMRGRVWRSGDVLGGPNISESSSVAFNVVVGSVILFNLLSHFVAANTNKQNQNQMINYKNSFFRQYCSFAFAFSKFIPIEWFLLYMKGKLWVQLLIIFLFLFFAFYLECVYFALFMTFYRFITVARRFPQRIWFSCVSNFISFFSKLGSLKLNLKNVFFLFVFGVCQLSSIQSKYLSQ